VRALPLAIVNRIAAGEVIERPAAVVKELVENAIDAGAARIAVSLAGGGIDKIEVSDDGRGMGPADLALAVLRHCTSKLDDDQLVDIRTLGFRGEALPSIGAAARLSILSRPRGQDSAHRISVAGGIVSAIAPAAGPYGTIVRVEDLFFATPARRKFLKTPRTEAEYAEAALRRLALARPDLAVKYEIDGRVVFDLPPQDRLARLESLLGSEAAAALRPIGMTRGEVSLSGFAALPSVHRATSAQQSLVVNGRPVTDPNLRTAIRVAYRDVIVSGRFPVVALWLTIPNALVDVNVHPAKSELRFADPDAIRGLVISAVRAGLAQGAGQAAYAALPDFRPAPMARNYTQSPPGLALTAPAAQNSAGFAEASLPFTAALSARPIAAPVPDAAHPLGAPVAQILDTYIIAATADQSVILVDQHAAHERLMQEHFSELLTGQGAPAQKLLLPAVVDLPPLDAARLAVASADLAKLGLEIESFGPGAILVRAMPALLGSPDPAPLLRDIADELAECGETTALAQRFERVIARLACHGSIRAGRRLTLAEMDALLRQMEATPRAATCSHGRPTYVKLTKAGIERLFGRA
jgi:DNA mismatch repair protein MutL